MDKAGKKLLYAKLGDLMALYETDWPGHPYVDDDGTFGVKAGKEQGGLYAAYFLMDKLAEGGLFRGGRNPRTDLDTAAYELATDKVFRVYDEAELFWNADRELQVRITTDRPLADVAAAIDAGIASVKEEELARKRAEQANKDKVNADRQRDLMPTVFSQEADLAFAAAYLMTRLSQEVPCSNLSLSQHPVDPEFSRIFNDTRPRLRVDYDLDPASNFSPVSRFNNEVLPRVFTGYLAVQFNMTAQDDGRMYVEVAGPPARLAADILDNDLAGGRETLKRLQGRQPQDILERIEKEIDRRYAQQVADSLKGGLKGAPVKAPGPAKFKKGI